MEKIEVFKSCVKILVGIIVCYFTFTTIMFLSVGYLLVSCNLLIKSILVINVVDFIALISALMGMAGTIISILIIKKSVRLIINNIAIIDRLMKD